VVPDQGDGIERPVIGAEIGDRPLGLARGHEGVPELQAADLMSAGSRHLFFGNGTTGRAYAEAEVTRQRHRLVILRRRFITEGDRMLVYD
jgi:hypothetical protein